MDAPETAPTEELLEATVVTYDHEPDECTIHPIDIDDGRKMTAWVTALDDAFCSLRSQQ